MPEGDKWGVGTKAKDKAFDTTMVDKTPVELIFGEHPHSRSDNTIYARFPGGKVEGFDGHRLLHEIKFRDFNYLKESGLSGDEVRKGGQCTIKINGREVDGFFYRDRAMAMQTVQHKLPIIHEHSIHFWDPEDLKKLIGRKVYYEHQPGIVTMHFPDQGCVLITADGHNGFRAFDHDLDSNNIVIKKDVKVSVWGDGIFWHRK